MYKSLKKNSALLFVALKTSSGLEGKSCCFALLVLDFYKIDVLK